MSVAHPGKLALLALTTSILAACGEPVEDNATAPPVDPAPSVELTPEAAPPVALDEPAVARRPSIPPPSAHVALNPGLYGGDGIELSLSALRFSLEAPEHGVSANGSYEVINGILSLAATAGETADVDFPLECRLTRSGPQIALDDVDEGSCGFLAGTLLERDTRPAITRPD